MHGKQPESQIAGTVVTPLAMDTPHLLARVDFFDSQIDLHEIRGEFSAAQVLHSDPLIICPEAGSYAVVLHFGAVVFWRSSHETSARILSRIERLPGMSPPVHEANDELSVSINQTEDQVNFRDVCLSALTLEHLKIISQALGQSAALKHCELCVSKALAAVSPVVHDLKHRGVQPRSGREIL